MELLSLVVAVGVALIVLASVIPGTAVRERLRTASVVLVAAVTSWAVGSQAWERVAELRDQRRTHRALSTEEAAVAGGAALEVNTAFLDWTRERLGPDDRFYLFPSGPQSEESAYQWATYQLLPRVSVSSPEEADALVFYNVDPRETDWDRSEFEPPVRYDPVFAVARRRGTP